MKKIIYIFLLAICFGVLVGCDKNGKNDFSLDITSTSELRESLVFECKLNDENNVLKDCDVKGALYAKDGKSAISTKTLSFSSEKTATVNFTTLDAATDYTVKFYVGYKGKNHTLVEKAVKTSTKGTEADPYLLTTSDDFTKILKNDRNGFYKLANDIDFEGKGITPIFSSGSAFNGSFDGAQFKIKNFVLGSEATPQYLSTNYAGIFGYIGANGVVKNVEFVDCNLTLERGSKETYVGFVAGYNAGLIENVTITNSKLTVSFSETVNHYIGGVVAKDDLSGVVKDCKVGLIITVNAKGTVYVGGVAAITNYSANAIGSIEKCNFTGAIDVKLVNDTETIVKAESVVGGIVGRNSTKVITCEAKGKISVLSKFKNQDEKSSLTVGGLVGKNINDIAVLKDSNAQVAFAVEADNKVDLTVGFICGQNGGKSPAYAKITNCKYTPTEEQNVIKTLEENNNTIAIVGVDHKDYEGETPSYSSTASFDYLLVVVEKDAEGNFVEKSNKTVSISA